MEKEALAVVEQIKQNGGSQAELDKARRSMLANQLSGLSTMRGKASDLGSNWLLTRNTNFSKDYLDAIARVTTEDLKRVAQKYLRSDRLNVTSLNPRGSLAGKRTDGNRGRKLGGQEIRSSEWVAFARARGLHACRWFPSMRRSAAGLLAENPENNGITRLLSRTILKGTKNRTAAQLAEQIESAGGRIGSDSGNNSFSVERGGDET